MGGSDFLMGGLVGVGKTMLSEFEQQNKEARTIRAEDRREEAQKRSELRRQQWQKDWLQFQNEESLKQNERVNTQRFGWLEAGTDAGVESARIRSENAADIELEKRRTMAEEDLLWNPRYANSSSTDEPKGLTSADAEGAMFDYIEDYTGVSQTEYKKPDNNVARYFSDKDRGGEVRSLLAAKDLDPGMFSDKSGTYEQRRKQLSGQLTWMIARDMAPKLRQAARNNLVDSYAPQDAAMEAARRAEAGLGAALAEIESLMDARENLRNSEFGDEEKMNRWKAQVSDPSTIYGRARASLYESMGYKPDDNGALAARRLWLVTKNGIDNILKEGL